jgi:hypothetical protein
MMRDQDFLSLLQQQAAKQAKLERYRFLPSELDMFTSFIGTYPWQVIGVVSGITALLLTVST